MIVRRKSNINPDVVEPSLQISFTTADIKDFMRLFCIGGGPELYWGSIGWQATAVAKREAVFREQEIREWAERDIHVFGLYEERWRQQLSAWFLRQAIKKNYFVQSEADPTCFYFGAEGMKLMKPRVDYYDRSQE